MSRPLINSPAGNVINTVRGGAVAEGIWVGRTAARRPAPDTGDERRNYYRITSAGMRVARAEAQRLELLTRVARLGGLLPKGVK